MIDQTEAMLCLSRMMGKRGSLPGGDNSDWKSYIQEAFKYAWRYYKWDWSLKTVTVNMETDPYMPTDFDIGGYREAVPDQNGNFSELKPIDFARRTYGNVFSLEYDLSVNRYKISSKSSTTSITFIYQVAPPVLTEDSKVPFPSAMTIGIGAAIYAKQGENPSRADISQEWDQFHHELDRHTSRSDKNTPRNAIFNLQDQYGTYTGDVRY